MTSAEVPLFRHRRGRASGEDLLNKQGQFPERSVSPLPVTATVESAKAGTVCGNDVGDISAEGRHANNIGSNRRNYPLPSHTVSREQYRAVTTDHPALRV